MHCMHDTHCMCEVMLGMQVVVSNWKQATAQGWSFQLVTYYTAKIMPCMILCICLIVQEHWTFYWNYTLYFKATLKCALQSGLINRIQRNKNTEIFIKTSLQLVCLLYPTSTDPPVNSTPPLQPAAHVFTSSLPTWSCQSCQLDPLSPLVSGCESRGCWCCR